MGKKGAECVKCKHFFSLLLKKAVPPANFTRVKCDKSQWNIPFLRLYIMGHDCFLVNWSGKWWDYQADELLSHLL